jgi:nucleoprotein TPR
LSTTHSSSSQELGQLGHRVEETEREKRELILVVDRLREDATRREGPFILLQTVAIPSNICLGEIDGLRLRLKETRTELSTVRADLGEVQSHDTSQKVGIVASYVVLDFADPPYSSR